MTTQNTQPETTSAWPDVAVVIPTRGRPELLRKAVQHVVDQDYPGQIEVIVVHDQETPDQSISQLGTGNRTVRAMANDSGPGLAGSRNAGIARTEAPIIASCDDDDYWMAGKLTKQVQRLKDDPALMVVGAGLRLVMGPDQVVEWVGPKDVITLADLARGRRKELHSSTLVMRREVFDQVGGYDESLPNSYAEDYEFLLRAVRLGPIGTIREPLAYIKKDGQSWFRERSEVIAEALTYLLRTHPELELSPRGHARILGQIAFAHAGKGDRREALTYIGRSMRRYPLAPQAGLALVQVTTGSNPTSLLKQARRFGRGLA
ncbi:MAG: glycosyltransferase family 2 protein [Actinomycetales bacterium]